MTFHVNGDAAIDSLIKAHEFAAADDPTKDRNVTAIHAQFTRKEYVLEAHCQPLGAVLVAVSWVVRRHGAKIARDTSIQYR